MQIYINYIILPVKTCMLSLIGDFIFIMNQFCLLDICLDLRKLTILNLSRNQKTCSSRYKYFYVLLGFCSFLNVLINGTVVGLPVGKTCRWCPWTGFVNFKIQNHELSYASEREASRSYQDKIGRFESLEKWTKSTCYGKNLLRLSLCFGALWNLTARQYGEVVLPDECTGQLSWFFSR